MKKLSLAIALSMIMMLTVAGCGKQVFDGSSTGNDVQFVLDYSVLNCTKTHDMKFEKGTEVDVIIENSAGSLDILVTGSDGKSIYKGDNADSGEFSIEIPETDTYTFSVTGRKAKGSVSFKVAE